MKGKGGYGGREKRVGRILVSRYATVLGRHRGVCTLLSIRNVGLDSRQFVDNARSVPFELARAVSSFGVLLG